MAHAVFVFHELTWMGLVLAASGSLETERDVRDTTRSFALMVPAALLTDRGDVNEDLVEAAATGSEDAITTALSDGADATAALTIAVERGLAEAVHTLPDRGADPAATASDGTPLIVLAASRRVLGALVSAFSLFARPTT